MKCNSLLILPVFIFVVIFSQPLAAQVENPIQSAVQKIKGPAEVRPVYGHIVPIFWKAIIDDATVTVPFGKIEFFGVQDYVIDGATRVKELTISTEAQSMIRIYHIRPVSAAKRVVNKVEDLRRLAEGHLPEAKPTEDEEKPVKVFPSTTHVHMVEYRVKNLVDIETLHRSLEAGMIEYHGRYLFPDLRQELTREVNPGG